MSNAAPDLSRCSTVEILVGMLEYETAEDASETWPEPVKRLITRELSAWRRRNPDRVVVLTQSMATNRQCLVTLYHQPASPALPAPGGQASAPPETGVATGPAAPPKPCGCGE